MAKAFSMGSPEYVAQFYGGDKQRILQALQTGALATIAPPPYDQTVAIAAAMHIDRMRSAQMQESVAPPTVAQQVMGGAPATPPASAPPAGGLGATTPAAPPMTPPMPTAAPPMPAPEGAPMGMAEGGLATLDVPETMFDEPTNGGFDDGYAGGGIVAFADGGGVDLDAFRRAIIQQESGGRYGIPNAQGSGAMGIGQIMPDTARALAKRLGLEYRPDLLAGTDKAARQYQDALTTEATREAWEYGGGDVGKAAAYYFAGPNRKGWGENTRKYQSAIMRRLGTAEKAPRAAAGLQPPSETLTSAIPAAFKAGEEYYAANMPERKNEGLAALTEAARRTLDPAAQKKRRDEDKWMMLAEIGFNMAASNSPYLLQAASAAAAAALPGARAAKKEREAEKREAIRDLAAAEDITYKQAAEKTKFITDFAAMQLGLKKDDLARSTNIWQTKVQEQGATERANIAADASRYGADTSAASYANTAEKQAELTKRQAMGRASQAALEEATIRFPFPPKGTPADVAKWDKARDDFYQQRYNFYLQSEIGADAGQGRTVSQGKIINAVPIPQ